MRDDADAENTGIVGYKSGDREYGNTSGLAKIEKY